MTVFSLQKQKMINILISQGALRVDNIFPNALPMEKHQHNLQVLKLFLFINSFGPSLAKEKTCMNVERGRTSPLKKAL